jgi:tetratricopeptide (TPR) repeat protein
MEPTKKNRIRFENTEADSNPDITQYETEEYTTRRKLGESGSFIPWLLFIILFFIVAAFGVWYQFLRPEAKLEADKGPTPYNDKLGHIDKIFEKPYLPESSLNPGLAKCINLYKQNYIKKAEGACEDFLNSPAGDKEKSIALTVQGVIYDASYGRYRQAIERLKTAIDYDPKNVYAYYNLTLAFKHAGESNNARMTANRAREIAPNDSRITLLAGNILNETNDVGEAMKVYKEGISQSPNDPYLIYNLALSQYKQGDMVEAIENFKKAIQASSGGQVTEFSHGYLGTIYYHRENLDAAEHHFREAVSLKPTEPKYLYNLGLILLKRKKNEEGLTYFQRAIDSGSGDPQIYRYIAESFDNLGMHDNAVAALEKAVRVRPDDADSLFQLADLYYKRGQLSQAEDLYRKIIRSTPADSSTENALVNLGLILDDQERYSEAVEVLQKAISLNPKNDSALFNLAIAYKNSGEAIRAVETWRKAQQSNPSEPRHQEAIGDYYYESGYYLESAKEFEELVKAHVHNHKFKLKLADAYYRLKNFEQAEKTLIQVLNQSKDSDEIKIAHRKLALVYSEDGGKNKSRALDEAYRGSHIDPEDMESRLILAKVLMNSGTTMDREKAIDELTAIVRSDVNPKLAAQAYNFLGLCYYKNKEFRKSMREFQNAIDLDPSLTEAYENKRAARASYEDSIQNRAGMR